jgi:hypothetical protein
MKKIATLSFITATLLMAGGEITPVAETSAEAEAFSFIKTVNGYIRAGYQNTDISGDTDYTDIALGGKLHIETASWNGISAGASFYTTNSIGEDEGYLSGAGMAFFDGSGNSYSILGESYLQGEWGNTTLKAGRQEIDTPFADTDDIGMIVNTFEAVTLVNTDIKDTTLVLAQVQKMAGVDAEVPGEFTKLNGDDGVQVFGATYEGIEGLSLSGWYYHANDLIKVPYLEATYEANLDEVTLGLGAQYAYMDWEADSTAKVVGASVSAEIHSTGLIVGAAYNKSSDGAADDLFGGGPFFTSSEHLTLPTAGNDGEAVMYTAEWDAGTIGVDGLTLGAGYLTLESSTGLESSELDIIASYAFNDALTLDLFYSDIDDKIESGDELTNLRVFVNYAF